MPLQGCQVCVVINGQHHAWKGQQTCNTGMLTAEGAHVTKVWFCTGSVSVTCHTVCGEGLSKSHDGVESQKGLCSSSPGIHTCWRYHQLRIACLQTDQPLPFLPDWRLSRPC